ncbi:MAG: class I SAM-dependent methyltransferase [Candidatus Rifleibacteriota bacterium]
MTSCLKLFFEKFLRIQDRLCQVFDRFLPVSFKRWGYRDFILEILPGNLKPGMKILDAGGGKRPVITRQQKQNLQLEIIGLDISAAELAEAPVGLYDSIIIGDLVTAREMVEADLVICLAVLEHVSNTDSAMKAIASMLKPGGRALIFVPSRNSLFARLNLLLPESLKRFLLHLFFRRSSGQQGFKSYYDRCTPSAMKCMAIENGLQVEEELYYFQSAYFSVFLPLYALYRILTLIQFCCFGNEAAETFTLVLRKNS